MQASGAGVGEAAGSDDPPAPQPPPPLPDEIWMIVLSEVDGIRAREMARVSRLFCMVWRTHADWVVPVTAPQPLTSQGEGVSDYLDHRGESLTAPTVSPINWDDYRCCECGLWAPANVPLDERILNPEYMPLRQAEVAAARQWLRQAARAAEPVVGYHGVHWEMRGVVAAWPGDVCRDCWDEWACY